MTGTLTGGWTVSFHQQGDEREPVVVIDGFAPDPQRFVDDAGLLRFAPMGLHYPGIRAAVPLALLTPLLDALAPVITDVFGFSSVEIAEAFYSLVTTSPEALTPIQRLPHFDGVEPERLALLHYLARDERSGTAFFHHRTTGFETITAARLPAYRTALAGDLQREGMPAPAYIAGDTGLFAETAQYQGLFNRAILYRGNSLHCARLPHDLNLSPDPAQGRLTVNTFLTGCGS